MGIMASFSSMPFASFEESNCGIMASSQLSAGKVASAT